ncbi:MAG: hypothetical protein ACLP2F_13635 [Steroidobacteraceae bacterium]
MPAQVQSSAATAQDTSCLTQTGSRIAANGTYCSGIGRSYTDHDVRISGAAQPAGALRLLDPDVTINH